MASYIECRKCKNFEIELIGDRELSCGYCANSIGDIYDESDIYDENDDEEW